MKRIIFPLVVLFVFSISAYAEMGMTGGQKDMPCGMMMEQKGGMKPPCMSGTPTETMGEGQQMPMMQMCMPMLKQMMGHGMMMQDMMQMMMDMMNMQEKMMMGVKPAEKKKMMKNMEQMKEKMQKMMSMGMMMGMDDSQARLKCAEEWLKKAIDLHEIHIKDPKTATDDSQHEMMDQMKKAYDCITGAVKGAPSEEPKTGEPKKEVTPKADPHKH